MKKLKIFLGLVFCLFFAEIVLAQKGMPRNYILERIRERNQITQEEFARIREEAKKSIIQNREEFTKKIRERDEEVMQLRRENYQQFIKNLINIKEIKKRDIVHQVYMKVMRLNDLICEHFLGVVEKLELMLERIESRAAKAALRGQDISEVELLISAAKLKTEETKTAIVSQASKVYSFDFSDEKEAKLKIGEVRQQFRNDINSLREKVKELSNLVKEAAIKLAQIPQVDELKIEENK